jgi:tight adherence protein B
MLPVLITMLLLLLFSGGALSAALMITRNHRLETEQRVGLVAATLHSRTSGKSDTWWEARGLDVDARVRHFFSFGSSHTWGMKASTIRLLTVAFFAGAIVWGLAGLWLKFPIFLALPISAMVAYLASRILLQRQQKRAEVEFTDLFPASVDSIARMLRAGLPITTAVRSVGAEGPPPVNAVFLLVSNQVEIGAPIEHALDSASERVGLADFRFFSVAVALQHATGGNLAATLEILADIIRRRRGVRMKARATTAEIRVSAYVLGSLPLLIIGLLLLIQPDYLTPLFKDPRGHVILAMAAGGLFLAAISMRQMMRSVTN